MQNVKIVSVSSQAFNRSQDTTSCGDLYIGMTRVTPPHSSSVAGYIQPSIVHS